MIEIFKTIDNLEAVDVCFFLATISVIYIILKIGNDET